MLIVFISSGLDYRKQSQFKALSQLGRDLTEIKVLRDHHVTQIHKHEVVVGDLVFVSIGDVLPADGVLIQGHEVESDESAMTGESIAIHKSLDKDPFMLSGTHIIKGEGQMLVIATGLNSVNGKSLQALQVEEEQTPLQNKLDRIARYIANMAMIGAVAMMTLLMITFFILNQNDTNVDYGDALIKLFIATITLVVVVIPEGLPLAVTLALAHATMKMLQDNNLVRNLSACETMGNATSICSDKTGTLTLNKMTVFQCVLCKSRFGPSQISEIPQTIPCRTLALIMKNLNVNSSAAESKQTDGSSRLQGSQTEMALLGFSKGLGYPYQNDRADTMVIHRIPFNSETKRMTTIVECDFHPDWGTTGLVKGAAEIILGDCTRILNEDGTIIDMDDQLRGYFESIISDFAHDALRTIAAAVKLFKVQENLNQQDIEQSKEMILLGIFGIQDPLRPEVPNAVARCQRAGVMVRMVTGDSLPTAKAIARECGILSAEGLVMEGPEFRKMTETEMNIVLPKLQVLARSSPLDKQILVKNLKRLGEIVAVTGDGTNDAPAMASADVGFSMGIVGTEVAKEASDIILMDDNFASIVKAVVWGRCVYDAIRKFIQFQFTVNISALIIVLTSLMASLLGPQKKPESVLSAVWTNIQEPIFYGS